MFNLKNFTVLIKRSEIHVSGENEDEHILKDIIFKKLLILDIVKERGV